MLDDNTPVPKPWQRHVFSVVLLQGLTALGFCACVPRRPPVTGAFVHPSLSVDALTREGLVVYGYRKTSGTLHQRREYDQELQFALQRALPGLLSVSPNRFKTWLEKTTDVVAFGAALDEGPEALPYDQLAAIAEKSRYFMWATVARADQRDWYDRDEEHADFCVAWQLQARYAIADLRRRELVAEVQVDLDERDCRRNPRSNTTDDASTVGGALIGALVDTVADATVDAAFGTYPDAPALSAQLNASAQHFLHWLHAPRAALVVAPRATRRISSDPRR